MSRRYCSKAHYQRISNGGPDTAEAIAERVAHRTAAEQAHGEMLERFAPLTTENVMAAFAWQAARIVGA